MTSTQVGLLVIQGLLSLVVSIYVAYELFKARREQQKYRFYALRDALLDLVATKKLSEEDTLFRVFYTVINKSMAELTDLTFMSFLKASARAKVTLEQQERSDELRMQLENARPEVRNFVGRFAFTMMEIMAANSFVVMVIIKMHMHTALQKIARPPRFARQRKDVQTYRYFEELHNCVAA
jgi:hypothetical protein